MISFYPKVKEVSVLHRNDLGLTHEDIMFHGRQPGREICKFDGAKRDAGTWRVIAKTSVCCIIGDLVFSTNGWPL